MKILILNWRDIKNPSSGGAEILTHEIARRWAKAGHEVFMFASLFAGAKVKENIDGITIYRAGKETIFPFHKSVHFEARRFYNRYFRGKIDIVIDEAHGIGFFTPFYVKEKKVVLVCEVAQDVWDYTFPFPLNIIGRLGERLYIFLYRNIQFMAISPSTKKDLENFGVDASKITVLPMGINRVRLNNQKKDKNPVILFVGRLSKIKGVEDALEAFITVSQKIKNASFWVVGRGDKEYIESLKRIVTKNKLTRKVIFWDFVPDRTKFTLMARASVLVVPSVREGFGLIVPEAGSVGTPVIVYDAPGLRDIVVDGVNGIKTKSNNPKTLSEEIIKLLSDKLLYSRLCSQAKKASLAYNWDRTAKTAMKVLQDAL